ncbi:MAG: hypothetical protein KDJ44_02095 [Rhodoblastus sp.]|nr:hypothetical protein [Rhodoblastus sp.]
MSSPFKPRQLALILAALIAASPAAAQAISENWNTGACGVTDVAAVTLDRPAHVRRIDLWFQWRGGETSVRYALSLNGAPFAEGELARADCDPVQGAWCVARVEPDTDLEAGIYEFRTARPGVCQNAGSGGRGFIRVYGEAR